MEEAERLKRYRKNPVEEEFFKAFNVCITPLETRFLNAADPSDCDCIFIVGPPRSGSTLLSQVLAMSGFGYVSNFMARFWNAPASGAFFQNALGADVQRGQSNFESSYGVTDGWFDSHEFGYFWNRWFDLGQETHTLNSAERARVDASALGRSIAAICSQFEVPVVFKNTTWCSTQADMLAQCLPKSTFVFLKRAPLSNAHSILKARRERYGAKNVWWSNRPSTFRELKRLPPYEQVILQVIDLLNETEVALTRIDPRRVVRINYEELCGNPRAAVSKVLQTVKVGPVGSLDQIPNTFENRNFGILEDEDWLGLQSAWAKLKSSGRTLPDDY